MIQQRIPDNQSRPSKLFAGGSSQSSSEDSIEISPSFLRLGGIKRQPSVGKILPPNPYSNDSDGSNHHLNYGLNNNAATFLRPKKSDLLEVKDDYRKFDTNKYAERENFPNQENIDNTDKSSKSSPNLAGNKKLKRFESNTKMTFDTRIQKAKYFSSSIAVSSMLKEMKQNDHERRGSEARFSSGENYLDTEVDDDSRIVNISETREQSSFFTEKLSSSHQVAPTAYRSQHSDHKDSGTDSAVQIDENEIEWLQSKTGISREQAITWYLTKNRGAQQQQHTPTPESNTVRGPSSGSGIYSNERVQDELKPSKKESPHITKAEPLTDGFARNLSLSTSSKSRSTLERIFDTVNESVNTEDISFRNTPIMKIPPVNKHADRDIRIREPLTTKSLAMLKTSSSAHGSYSTARINGNKFNVEVDSQHNDAISLSSSVINNENLSSLDIVDDNRQEFYESFDKQVNLLMKRGLSREEAFSIQMQLQSQNVDPNITESVDDGRKYYMDTNEISESAFEDPRQQELDKLMAYGMTGEQAELFLQQLSASQNTAPPQSHPHQHPLVTKVAVRPLQQAEEHSPEVDEDEPFDDYQQKVKRFMQMGYTQEQAELAISMQSQRPDRATVDNTRRQDAPIHQGNRGISSNPPHSNGSIPPRPKQPLIDSSDTFDANDESEIAALVARGYTRAEAIISIMAADEAEAIQNRSSSNGNSAHQNFPSTTTSSYPSSTFPIETGAPIQPIRHAAIQSGGNFSRVPQHMPSYPPPVSGPSEFGAYDDSFGSYHQVVDAAYRNPPVPSQPHAQLPYVPPRPAHQPVPPPSINIGTYFKAENPDDEALELGILLSHQEAMFGQNMFEALRVEDSVAVDSYITSGYTYNDAVLDVFDRKNGFSRPLPRFRQRQGYNGYQAQAFNTYPGRGHHGGDSPNQMYPVSNNSMSFSDEPSGHRRNTMNSIYFVNNPAFPSNSVYGSTLSSSSAAATTASSLHNQLQTNRYLPSRSHIISSGSTVATAPVARNPNRRGTFVGPSSASSVPGDYLRSRTNAARGNHARRDVTVPTIQTYPPPESAIDTHWRKGFKVENCKKSAIKRLMNMGFREEEAVQALLETGQNEKHAAQLLYANRAHYFMY